MDKEVHMDELRYTIVKLESDVAEANAKLTIANKALNTETLRSSNLQERLTELSDKYNTIKQAHDGLISEVNELKKAKEELDDANKCNEWLKTEYENAENKSKDIAKLYAEATVKYIETRSKLREQAKIMDALEEANDGLTEKVNSMGKYSKGFEVGLEIERQRIKYRDNTIQRMDQELRELKEKLWMMENNC